MTEKSSKPSERFEQYRSKRRVEIGENIFLVRHRLGISQAQLADELDCSRYKVYRVERGLAEFTATEMEHLASVFNMPLSDLLHFPLPRRA